PPVCLFNFFCRAPAPPDIHTLSLHDALPISHIGNYGVSRDDSESRRPFCRGVIVRDLASRASSWRAEDDLASFLVRHGVPGIARSEEHTSELQSRVTLVCRHLLEQKKQKSLT